MDKYYKTVIQVTILSQDSPVSPNMSLESIEHEMTHGEYSGEVEIISTQELSANECAQELISQGSDPEFFGLEADDE